MDARGATAATAPQIPRDPPRGKQVVDFGHASKSFPMPTYLRQYSWPQACKCARPLPRPASGAIPREQLRIDDLSRQIETEGYDVPAIASAPINGISNRLA